VSHRLNDVVKAFRSLAPVAAGLAFVLAVVGSWIRINGAGMTCPDWPLCHGAVVPALIGGVVLEWSHRMLALLESVVVAATILTGWRVRDRIAGLAPALSALGAIFVVQVLLGGATVRLGNSPISVMLHWGMAMALLATLTVVALLAAFAPEPSGLRPRGISPAGALAVAAGLGFVTMCIGSYVSSSFAGLACPTLPDCNGSLTGHNPAQLVQMLHRLGAAAFAIAALMATFSAARTGSPRARNTAFTGMLLLFVQIGLGAANVLLHLPNALREAHAANAALTFLCFVAAAVFARIDPVQEALPATRAAGGWRGAITDYYELTKPRIIVLLLITTLAAMIMAARGLPPLGLTLITLIGGALAAASGGVFNCVIDRDIDLVMQRTMSRPLPQGRVTPTEALIFAGLLGTVSFALLYICVNPLAAWLSLAGNAYYVIIYTLWLKRTTTLNIVIGGAAGAVPPLVGWAAVTGHIGAPAVALFALIFLWTPPHFWALALMVETDYHKANVPMLPNVRGVQRTKIEIFIYTVVLVAFSLALTPLGVMGMWYFAAAAVLGAIFLVDAWKMFGGPTKPLARALFSYSLVYLGLMCLVMVADRIIA
jgi:protoheme IX farnesyltransferase